MEELKRKIAEVNERWQSIFGDDHIVDDAEMVTEPAGDLVERVEAVLQAYCDGTTGRASAARAIVALFAEREKAAEAEHQRTLELLKAPAAVLVNMQRGTVAVPSLRACLDLHGKLDAWDAAGELVRAVEKLFNPGDRSSMVVRYELGKAAEKAIAAGIGGSHEAE